MLEATGGVDQHKLPLVFKQKLVVSFHRLMKKIIQKIIGK